MAEVAVALAETADILRILDMIPHRYPMLMVEPDVSGGGRSLILDVDSIRDEVRHQLGEETLRILETEAVPWRLAPYLGGGIKWRTVLDQSRVCWRRYTIDLALGSGEVEVSDEMSAALDALEELIGSTNRMVDFLMGEGELLFLDNTRSIHARTPLENSTGADRLMIRSWIRAC